MQKGYRSPDFIRNGVSDFRFEHGPVPHRDSVPAPGQTCGASVYDGARLLASIFTKTAQYTHIFWW